MQRYTLSTKYNGLVAYINNLMCASDGSLNISVQAAAIICQHFGLTPESFLDFTKSYCDHAGIELIFEEGGPCAG